MNHKELLEKLYNVTLSELIARIESGTASPSDLNVARQMLKDNNIDAFTVNQPAENGVKRLTEVLPFDESESAANG